MYLDFAEPQFRNLIVEAMAARGTVPSVFGSGSKRFEFDPSQYGFRNSVERHFQARGLLPSGTPLEELHRVNDVESLTVDSSGQSPVSSSLYEIDADFYENYRRFLREIVRTHLFDFDFYFQDVPTFRCSVPGSPGYNWRPNYHTDIAIGHPPNTINFWLPVTECSGNNSLIYADLDDSIDVWRDFQFNFKKFHATLDENDELFQRCQSISKSFDASDGEGLVFDSRCMHLHQKNDTQQARVSFDFRIIPVDAMNAMDVAFVGTGRRKAQFKPGEYYFEKSVDQL